MLTFFLRRALDIYRLPYYEDRIFCDLNYNTREGFDSIVNQLTRKRIDEIASELKDLYFHTQSNLAKANLTSITLKRSIYNSAERYGESGYADKIATLKEVAENLGKSHIPIEFDTLNSYSAGNSYQEHPVTISTTIRAKDILYCSEFIGSRIKDVHKPAVESGEWVVINRSPTGTIQIPTKAIHINNNSFRTVNRSQVIDFELYWNEYTPYVLRQPICHHQYLDCNRPFKFKKKLKYRLKEAWRALIQN